MLKYTDFALVLHHNGQRCFVHSEDGFAPDLKRRLTFVSVSEALDYRKKYWNE